MGQIIGSAAKPKRCNLNKLSQLETPAAGEYILVSSDNSMNENGQGNFDCYIVGDGRTAATALPLIKIDKALYDALENFKNNGRGATIGYNIASGGHITFDDIVLSQNGDSLEFDINTAITGGTQGGYNLHLTPILGVCVSNRTFSIRADDYSWVYTENSLGATFSDWFNFKVAIENGNLNIYVNGTYLKGTAFSKTITLKGLGGTVSTFQPFVGSIKNYKYTHSGVTTLLPNFSNLAVGDNVTTIDNPDPIVYQSDIYDGLNSESPTKVLSARQGKALNDALYAAKCPYNSALANLGGWCYNFNGASSKITLENPIILSQDGDSMELGINGVNNESLAAGGYGFAVHSAGLALGLSATMFYVRATDGTWLFRFQNFAGVRKIKIIYANGNVLLYKDGVLLYTYTGQKTIKIDTFGYSASYGYWSGVLEYVKVNDAEFDLENGNTLTDVEYSRRNGFLTNEQASLLSANSAEMYVKKSATQLDIYLRTNKGVFIHYPFQHREKAYTAGQYPSFYDNWGIGQVKEASFDGVAMNDNADLFASGEAELAVSVPSGSDSSTNTYVGGSAHGFENIIDGTNGREFCILIDNIAIGETDVIDLTPASKVEIKQRTNICQAYTNTDPFAEATKHWLWENGKMKCTTSLKILRSLTFAFAQFGMMCILRRWEGNTSNDYLTNIAIKNSEPFHKWDVTDGWSGTLQTPDAACTQIIEYGQMGYGFSLSIETEDLKTYGGMFVATNNGIYNKIYFDLGRAFAPNVNDVLSATQIWDIFAM